MGFFISAASDLVETGKNPECADYDNPTGAIIRENLYLMATTEKGLRFVGPILGMRREFTDEEIDQLVTDTQRQVDSGELDVTNHPDWQRGRSAYGSEQYEADGQEFQDAFEERQRG